MRLVNPADAYALGLFVGFALALPVYLALDRLLDLLTRRADRVGHDESK